MTSEEFKLVRSIEPYHFEAAIAPPPLKQSTGRKKAKTAQDLTEDDFGYFEPTHVEEKTAVQIRKAKLLAGRQNPPGVKVAGLVRDDKRLVAGYLFFKDTMVFTVWVEDKLGDLLAQWEKHKRLGFGIVTKDPASIISRWDHIKMFEIIADLNDHQTSLITGDDFPITAAMLNVDPSRADPGHFCYLHTMHRIISQYPDHFPNDVPSQPNEIHGRENWFRALAVLRLYWSYHSRDDAGKARVRAIMLKPAVKPLYIGDGEAEELTLDGSVNWSLAHRNDFFRELAKASEHEVVTTRYLSAEDCQLLNEAEIEDMHKSMSKKKDIPDEHKLDRPMFSDEMFDTWLKALEEHLKGWIVPEPAKPGPSLESETNPAMQELLRMADIRDTHQCLSTEEKAIEGKREFFAIIDKMSTASAAPKPFVECCESLDLDPRDVTIPGLSLTPYPHQIIDMKWLMDMEKTPIHGGILASECGSGKTIVVLLLIYLTHLRLIKEESDNHTPTLILCPAVVVDVWYNEFTKFFRGALTCRIFYGRPNHKDAQRQKCYVGSHASDLDAELEKLDRKDPNTSRTFFLSAYSTFSYRCMKIVGEDEEDDEAEEERRDKEWANPTMEYEGLERYTMILKHGDKFGRVVADEAHFIKNPRTLAADSIMRLKCLIVIAVTATPLINRINDGRGYLTQFVKKERLRLRLPGNLEDLVSIYDENFDATTLFPPRDGNADVEALYQAIEDGFPIHKMDPQAFLEVGNKSQWDAETARKVLRPILNTIQRRRLMSHAFETVDGKIVTPGASIPHYTVKTIRLKMSEPHSKYFNDVTAEWWKKLFTPEEPAAAKSKVKQSNSEVGGSINQEAYRGLQHASMDLKLAQLTLRKRKDKTRGSSKKVQKWYSKNDDHGVSYKYYKTRPEECSDVPVHSNRLDAAWVHFGKAPKLKEMVCILSKWKKTKERALVFFNWPMCQWNAEALLVLLGFKVLSLCSFHSNEERRGMIRNFNDPEYECDVMLIGFRIGSYGLNFHHHCWKMVIMEYPGSIDVLLQVFGRIHRLGQKQIQEIIILFQENSYDGAARSNMADKFLAKLAAEGDYGHVASEDLWKEAGKTLRTLLGEPEPTNPIIDALMAIVESGGGDSVKAEDGEGDSDKAEGDEGDSVTAESGAGENYYPQNEVDEEVDEDMVGV